MGPQPFSTHASSCCGGGANDRSSLRRNRVSRKTRVGLSTALVLGASLPLASGLVSQKPLARQRAGFAVKTSSSSASTTSPWLTTATPRSPASATELNAISFNRLLKRGRSSDIASSLSSDTDLLRPLRGKEGATRIRLPPVIPTTKTSDVVSVPASIQRLKDEEEEKNADYQWTAANMGIALPALLGLLADPVLSMVDTGFVGRISAVDLAALGVCTSIFHMAFTIFRATTVATTSLVGSASSKKNARIITKISLQLAGVLGTLVLLALRFGGPALLGTMGVSQSSPLYKPACSYLFARCWAAPAVVGLVVAEGAFRGSGDSRTPLVASAVATVINLVLDPLLMFPFKMGMAGAAAATALSQFGAAGVYAWRMMTRKLLPQKEDKDEDPNAATVKTSSVLKAILGANMACLAKQGSMLVFYTYATALATRMGPVHVATHQVALSFFWLVTFWLDSGSISGQVLMSQSQLAKREEVADDSKDSLPNAALPTPDPLEVEPIPDRNLMSEESMAEKVVAVNEDSKEDSKIKLPKTPFKARSLTKYMVKYALLQGVACALVVGGVGRFLPAVFTTDTTIQKLLLQLLPHLGLQQVIVSLTLILEGMAIGGDQFRFMAVGTSLATAFGVWQLSCATSVVGIWARAVTSFFVARFAVAVCGVWRVHRGINRQYEARAQEASMPLLP